MSLGYEGLLLFDSNPVLCTGASVPFRRTIIESNSGYSGIVTPSDPTKGLMRPRTYGWPENNGNFSFDGTRTFIASLINWILNRRIYKRIDVKPTNGSLQRFDECYWTSITLSANEGSFVNGSIDFVAVERTSETINGDYIGNKVGSMYSYFTQMLPLNPSVTNEHPIPFWKTYLDTGSSYLMSWTLNLSQEIQFYFNCNASGTPIKPSFIGIGTMTGDIQLEYYVNGIMTPSNSVASIDLHIGNNNLIKLRQLELQERNSDIVGPNDNVTLSMTYNIYGIDAT